MPRVNVEEKLWKDDRFLALVAEMGRFKAAGVMVCAWKLAQNFWVRGELIPPKLWAMQRFPNSIFEVGLAERREGGVYVAGSEEQFKWLMASIANGKKSRKSTPNADPVWDQEQVLNENEQLSIPTGVRQDPLPLSLLSSLKEEEPPIQIKVGEFLEAAYKSYPRKVGKSRGFKKLQQEIKTEVDFKLLLAAIDRYKKCDEVRRGFIKHFSTFVSEWRDWLDPEAGQTTSTHTGPKFLDQGAIKAIGGILATQN